jgi:ABC-2 type transport system permease protein
MTLNDIRTVMWKAQKDLFRIQGRRGQTILMLFTPLMLAILMPLQLKEEWLTTGFSLLIAIIIPLLLVGTSIPASFASEREQHTLPTLLASRLSDRAILYGKIATAVAYGWGVTVIVLLASLLTSNIVLWEGRLRFFEPTVFLADVVISLLFALLTAGAGVLFSLRAESVQQAQQSLMAVMLVPLMILQVGFVLLGTMSDSQDRIRELLGTFTFEQFCLMLSGLLLVLAIGLLAAARRSFTRERLILG